MYTVAGLSVCWTLLPCQKLLVLVLLLQLILLVRQVLCGCCTPRHVWLLTLTACITISFHGSIWADAGMLLFCSLPLCMLLLCILLLHMLLLHLLLLALRIPFFLHGHTGFLNGEEPILAAYYVC
jgi:hypothetical protein